MIWNDLFSPLRDVVRGPDVLKREGERREARICRTRAGIDAHHPDEVAHVALDVAARRRLTQAIAARRREREPQQILLLGQVEHERRPLGE